jgi:(1->4)-alpha-D-glucan 1-alpha-D-glucosylmutase
MAPERNDEYLLYQTMLGAWPPDSPGSEHLDTFRERMTAYMFKAAREAKVHTSWVNPNEEYESALQSFVNALLDDRRKNRFLEDIRALQRRLAFYGRINSLAQVLLKLTVPGIPDFYQGTELWDLSLVDPDNRRPVDYERRRAMLAELNRRLGQADDLSAPIRELLETAQDGRIKLYLIHKVLRFRRSHKDLFSRGSYLPLEVVGEAGEHVCAFARIRGSEAALVVIPRLVVRLTAGIEQWPLGAGIWRDTRLALPLQAAGESYHNPLTGETAYAELEGNGRVLRLSSILNSFPVALLVRN